MQQSGQGCEGAGRVLPGPRGGRQRVPDQQAAWPVDGGVVPLVEADALLHRGIRPALRVLQQLGEERHPLHVLVLGVLLPAGVPDGRPSELCPLGQDRHRPRHVELRGDEARVRPPGAPQHRRLLQRPLHGRRALGRRQHVRGGLLPQGAVVRHGAHLAQAGRDQQRQARLHQAVPVPHLQDLRAQGCAVHERSLLQLHHVARHPALLPGPS
mmetsp:Transcript_29997/g.89105  ORF Transcript_29997/g.89105 Transcript_29997/m.89105 type:complete len:212 (+) Transcript_29997:1623-2258(+)